MSFSAALLPVFLIVPSVLPVPSPGADDTDDRSALARAIAQGTPVADLPHALAVPVVSRGRAVAAIELRRFALALDEPALHDLLAAASAALDARAEAERASDPTVLARAAATPRVARPFRVPAGAEPLPC